MRADSVEVVPESRQAPFGVADGARRRRHELLGDVVGGGAAGQQSRLTDLCVDRA